MKTSYLVYWKIGDLFYGKSCIDVAHMSYHTAKDKHDNIIRELFNDITKDYDIDEEDHEINIVSIYTL